MKLSKKKWNIIAAFIAIILIIIIVFFKSISTYFFSIPGDPQGELLKVLLTVFGGIAVLVGLYFSYWRLKQTEDSVKAQAKQVELSRISQIDERFKNAIEHIGSEKDPVILGGIAELHQIAFSNMEQYSSIVSDIFCDLVRRFTNIEKHKTNSINNEIVQIIMNYLFQNQTTNPYNLCKKNLSWCNLQGLDMRNLAVSNSDFSHAIMPSLFQTNFTDSTFGYSYLINCRINECKFTRCVLEKIVFNQCNLYQDSFFETSMTNIDFLDCMVFNVSLHDLECQNIRLYACEIQQSRSINTRIMASRFIGSCFSDSKFSSKALLLHGVEAICSVFDNVELSGIIGPFYLYSCSNEARRQTLHAIESNLQRFSSEENNVSGISPDIRAYSTVELRKSNSSMISLCLKRYFELTDKDFEIK